MPTLLQPPLTGSEPLSQQAYRELRRLIITLQLAPGSPVSESELGERLGLGRTPIREAVRALAAERLIEVYPRRGMFVADVNPRELEALAELRAEVEPFAASLAAKRRTAAQVATIDALLADLARPIETSTALIELDQRIHHHVYACAANPVLAEVCEQQYVHALRIWFLALDKVAGLTQAVTQTKDLLVAIKEGDSTRAGEVMAVHINGFENQIQEAI